VINIPLTGADPLPWGFFVLQAARGGVQVPDWVLLAIPAVVSARLGIPAEEVTGEDVERALEALPADPVPLLERLLEPVDLPVPSKRATFRLGDEAALGAFREAVDHLALLHDAALMVRLDYGSEGFFACCDALEDPAVWDARGAVAAMIYLLLLLLDAG